jgi:hypothetical protein
MGEFFQRAAAAADIAAERAQMAVMGAVAQRLAEQIGAGCFGHRLSLVAGLVCHHRQRNYHHRLDASVGASGPHGLMSSRFFGPLKTAETPENRGLFRFLLEEQKGHRNPPGPNRP